MERFDYDLELSTQAVHSIVEGLFGLANLKIKLKSTWETEWKAYLDCKLEVPGKSKSQLHKPERLV